MLLRQSMAGCQKSLVQIAANMGYRHPNGKPNATKVARMSWLLDEKLGGTQ
jgi:hypothetical protein